MRHALANVEVFLKVVEAGSITAAAEQLGLAKSAVSARVAELESGLGVRLLTRSKRGVSPTAAGERMKTHGESLLSAVQQALEEVRQAEAEPSGQVRISIPAGIADDLLVPVLSAFLQRHPRLRIDVLATDSLVDLRQAGVDVALRFGWIESGDFVARKLATYGESLVASPLYLNAQPLIISLPDLARHAWIGYTGFGGISQKLQLRDASGRLQQVMVECRLRTSNAPSQKAWCLAGLGITRLPDVLVQRELADGQLMTVLPQFRLDGPSLYAVYLTDRYRTAGARALLDFLDSSLRR
jgi:DNA-binding transcriptional LysR family regulator